MIEMYSSHEPGAPVLNNAAGSLIAVLAACLVTGYNTKTVGAVTITGEVATATVSGHGQPVDNVQNLSRTLEFAGAGTAEVNGRHTVTVVDANTLTFPVPGASNGTVSGVITCKRPGAGWLQPYTGTAKAVFARSAPQASTGRLRLEDPAGEDALAFGVETATSVDAYTDRFPTTVQMSTGFIWTKGAATTAAKNWVVVASELGFHLFTDTTGYTNSAAWSTKFAHMWFGDIISYKPGDAGHCLITGGRSAGSASGCQSFPTSGAVNWSSSPPTDAAYGFLMRSHTGLQKSVGCGLINPSENGLGYPTKWYPDVVSNGALFIEGAFVVEANTAQGNPIRGMLPGSAQPMFRATDFTAREYPDVLTTTLGGAGKFLVRELTAHTSVGQLYAVRISGEWYP